MECKAYVQIKNLEICSVHYGKQMETVLCILDSSFLELRIYFFKDKSLHLLID